MKRLAIIFGIMCFGAYLMLTEKDKKQFKKEGEKFNRKFRKTHFPAKEPISD